MLNQSIISGFRGEYRFLSNFYPSDVEMDGEIYPTVEHAYQAAKTTDTLERKVVQLQITPALAKAAGNSRVIMRHYRSDWDDVKVEVMLGLLRKKFSADDLRIKLIGTGDAYLVEGNTWGDTFWGQVNGKGENNLGILLMIVRSEAR